MFARDYSDAEYCVQCGRLKTEITGYPEAENKRCWWCEDRAAQMNEVPP
jgi:hypothetical protein